MSLCFLITCLYYWFNAIQFHCFPPAPAHLHSTGEHTPSIQRLTDKWRKTFNSCILSNLKKPEASISPQPGNLCQTSTRSLKQTPPLHFSEQNRNVHAAHQKYTWTESSLSWETPQSWWALTQTHPEPSLAGRFGLRLLISHCTPAEGGKEDAYQQ